MCNMILNPKYELGMSDMALKQYHGIFALQYDRILKNDFGLELYKNTTLLSGLINQLIQVKIDHNLC